MNDKIPCPICQERRGSWERRHTVFECESCGTYCTEPSLGRYLEYDNPPYPDWDLTPVQRAILAREKYLFDQSSANESDQGGSLLFNIDDALLERIRDHGRLPNRREQAANLIRFVGDEVSRSGQGLKKLPEDIHLIIGTVNFESACRLALELIKRRVLTSNHSEHALLDTVDTISSINLTLDGWEQYEEEQRGTFEGNYGFIAMQFNEPELDAFVRNVVKPTVKETTGCELEDLRDVSRAGLIDNIMVTKIRDAKFIIADLTHNNHGAYWEAGFAEGLGKPVIYICNKEKFENGSGTHFDTNHYTTVLWSQNDVESFCRELSATLRRSLDGSPRVR